MEQRTKNDRSLQIHMTQAYLEMARYWSMVADAQDRQETINALYAIFAHTYIFSYLAVQAFVAYRLHEFWKSPTATLKDRYPAHTTFDLLMKRQDGLGELKKAIKELCTQYGIPGIHEADSQLWTDFTNFVREARTISATQYQARLLKSKWSA